MPDRRTSDIGLTLYETLYELPPPQGASGCRDMRGIVGGPVLNLYEGSFAARPALVGAWVILIPRAAVRIDISHSFLAEK